MPQTARLALKPMHTVDPVTHEIARATGEQIKKVSL